VLGVMTVILGPLLRHLPLFLSGSVCAQIVPYSVQAAAVARVPAACAVAEVAIVLAHPSPPNIEALFPTERAP
jgi:hypothetical protein